MTIFKCKMCGGTLEVEEAQSVSTCEYCGTKQTLPKLDNERKANLYDRADHLRRNNEFDRAMAIYENILNEDSTDAEAYWLSVLCRYGVEYVEDPSTHKRVPTVNRTQYTSIFEDEDYKAAISNADLLQRAIYEAEAAVIDNIQKGILELSQKEKPFDVFICYKETDAHGRRTQDSVLATELYYELLREGFRVFFSRITLEDKLGEAYEPYIFAALQSARVMVVLGTRAEYFNAVWVKNEWSRYLALIKKGAKKMIIPAYRDMDPYDLPEEFSHLQAQDMARLGFMQDLTRGIKKILGSEMPKAPAKETTEEMTVQVSAALKLSPLLKRAFMFLEDGEFGRADDFCEQILNQDPENAQAYLGKLMVELRVRRKEELADCEESFEGNPNYQKAIRFADDALTEVLTGYIATIKDKIAERAEQARKEASYIKAVSDYKSQDIERIGNAVKEFSALLGYKDSDDLIFECQQKIKALELKQENERIERERLAEQKRLAAEKAQLEKKRRQELRKINALKRAKVFKRIAAIFAIVIVVSIAFGLLMGLYVIPEIDYKDAVELMEAGQYEEAIWEFRLLGDYRDSSEKLAECEDAMLNQEYEAACMLLAEGKYKEAVAALEALDDYKDSLTMKSECEAKIADQLQLLLMRGEFEQFLDYADDLPTEYYLTGLTLSYSEKQGLYNVLADKITKTSMYAFNSSVGDHRRYFNLIADYPDAANVLAFCELYRARENNDYIALFRDNMYSITAMWETNILRELFVSDDILTYYLHGNWEDSSGYYLNFYRKEDGETTSTWCNYNLPYPDINHMYWDIQDLEFVFLDDDHNVVAKVYKFDFLDANTLQAYCYKNSKTYTLVRDIYTEGLTFASYYDQTTQQTMYTVSSYDGDSENVMIPASYKGHPVTSIDDEAFYYCGLLESVEFPDTLTVIGKNAFTGCLAIEQLVLPESVVSIGQGAFSSCTNLQTVHLGKNVKIIGAGAFSGCHNLTTIVYEGTLEQWNAIHKEESWDFNIGNYTVQCYDAISIH